MAKRCCCIDKANLQAQIDALQAQIDGIVDTDDQQITLVGNTLVLQDGGSVDLTPFLDDTDTDDQIITNFTLSAAGILTLAIQDGNTVTVDLSNLDTDDQTLSLAGSILTIADGNSVDLSQFEETLSTTTETIYEENFAGGSSNGQQSGAWTRAATVTRIGAGRWVVAFASAHADGVNYHPSLTTHESLAFRDTPDITIEEGTKTATGFRVMITTGDNGAGADTLVDAPWSFGVDAPVTVLTGAVLS